MQSRRKPKTRLQLISLLASIYFRPLTDSRSARYNTSIYERGFVVTLEILIYCIQEHGDFNKGAIRWLSAGMSLSRSHHCVKSLSLCLYIGITTLHRGTIPIATVLHSANGLNLQLNLTVPWTKIKISEYGHVSH